MGGSWWGKIRSIACKPFCNTEILKVSIPVTNVAAARIPKNSYLFSIVTVCDTASSSADPNLPNNSFFSWIFINHYF